VASVARDLQRLLRRAVPQTRSPRCPSEVTRFPAPVLSGDEPDPRPGEPGKGRPIDIGRDHAQASLITHLPRVGNNHPDQLWHNNLASLARLPRSMPTSTTMISRVGPAVQHPQLPLLVRAWDMIIELVSTALRAPPPADCWPHRPSGQSRLTGVRAPAIGGGSQSMMTAAGGEARKPAVQCA
jgi:hypothetical protein